MIQSSVTSPSHCSCYPSSTAVGNSISNTSHSESSLGDVIDHEVSPPASCHVTGSDLSALRTLQRGHDDTLLPLLVSPMAPRHVDSLLLDHPRRVTVDTLPMKRSSNQQVADLLIRQSPAVLTLDQAASQPRVPANNIAERLRLLTAGHWPSERPRLLGIAPTLGVTGLSAADCVHRHRANAAVSHRDIDILHQAGSRLSHVTVPHAASVWASSLSVSQTLFARQTTPALNDHRHHRHTVIRSTATKNLYRHHHQQQQQQSHQKDEANCPVKTPSKLFRPYLDDDDNDSLKPSSTVTSDEGPPTSSPVTVERFETTTTTTTDDGRSPSSKMTFLVQSASSRMTCDEDPAVVERFSSSRSPASRMTSVSVTQAVSSTSRRYGCDLCGRLFSRSNTLVTHRRIHTGEKPFTCQQCGRAFRQPGNLTRHRLTHTALRPFICPVCHKSFNRSSNLQTHLRVHDVAKHATHGH